jgi:hypothetical protein
MWCRKNVAAKFQNIEPSWYNYYIWCWRVLLRNFRRTSHSNVTITSGVQEVSLLEDLVRKYSRWMEIPLPNSGRKSWRYNQYFYICSRINVASIIMLLLLVMGPRRGSTPRQTDWLTVSRKVTLTLMLLLFKIGFLIGHVSFIGKLQRR